MKVELSQEEIEDIISLIETHDANCYYDFEHEYNKKFINKFRKLLDNEGNKD